ncbi:homeobox protein luminidependens-like [Trifolium pratense]|uniref:Homeobox protein luminidependens-like n=2 Tax=Trifolium pratense TaxID=57577 RepID=A0A2K3NQS5_TRIPR|nr:homeobox protein luminidependens-like [Trifolium pratense]PNY05958.1 homeobox protein luminidependens-like [Trifolium pratense]
MQSVFSIKDAISKKESREISALFGVTVTQVRDYFTSQRSRVRKQVQLSKERALKSNSCAESLDVQINSDPVRSMNPAPLNSVGATNVEEASYSAQEAALSDLDDSDKQFVENIFGLMQKEETFCGQEKLLEWILTIRNFSVLLWFLTGGGAMTLANWLSKAAVEEQTSVLLLVLKPVYSGKLSYINMADSNFIGQTIGPESWHFDVPEDILALSNEFSDDFRKPESQSVKLLLSSSDDYNKKHPLGVSSSRILGESRERRKVQLVEQPGSVSRSPQAARTGPVSQGRPMSADDIQKAKMRALFMQSKYGKTASKENKAKINSPSKSQTKQASIAVCSSKVPVPLKNEEDKKPLLLPSKTTNRPEAPNSKLKMDLKEPLWEKCKRVKIPWKTPADREQTILRGMAVVEFKEVS